MALRFMVKLLKCVSSIPCHCCHLVVLSNQIPALPIDRYWFRSNATQHTGTLRQETMKPLRGTRWASGPCLEWFMKQLIGWLLLLMWSHDPVPRKPAGVDKDDPSVVHVDPHVLATPVLADINDDGIVSELVIPVTYYYDPYQYR